MLAGAGALLRLPAMGPSSLWLDDAWVALAHRADGVAELWLQSLTAPGFTLALAGWLGLTGFSETAAQALPFAAGVAAGPLLYLVVVRRGLSPLVGLLAGSVLVTSPIAVEYATRVKHYTLDALAATALLGLAWWLAQRPADGRRWVVLVATAVVTTIMSAGVAPVVAGVLAAGGVAALTAGPAARRLAALAIGYYALFAAGWWLAVVQPASSEGLRDYWGEHLLPIADGPQASLVALGAAGERVLTGLTPLPLWASAALLVGGLAWLAWRHPAMAAAVAVPPAVVALLAAAGLAPLGGGRTDLVLYPGLALALAAALAAPLRRHRSDQAGRLGRLSGMTALALVTLLVGALAVSAQPAGPYPAHDVRPLVAELDGRLAGDAVVIVYPSAIWAYALYTDLPVRPLPTDEQSTGWQPRIIDPRVHMLGRHRDAPQRYEPEVAEIVDIAGDGHVWLLASHIRDDLEVIEASLDEAGLTEVERRERPGALLSRWKR